LQLGCTIVAMCGRYSLADLNDLFSKRFKISNYAHNLTPRYNVSPTQVMPVVVRESEGENRAELMQWGLIPSWSKDGQGVPASSFFEWKPTKEGKIPYVIRLKGQELFAMAGLYEEWIGPEGLPIKTYTILTCHPNQLMQPIHDRMPVILKPELEAAWLDPRMELPRLNQMLKPYSAEWMEAYPVSRAVNSPFNDAPELIKPAS
jgi:putative SOS response-associated peptidase YedK